MNNVGPHPAGKGPVAPPTRKPSKIEAGITDTLADLEEDNRRLREENEKLRLAGNFLHTCLRRWSGMSGDGYLNLNDPWDQTEVETHDALRGWREALRP